MKYNRFIYGSIFAGMLFSACQQADGLSAGEAQDDDVIHVGGVQTNMLLTHALTRTEASPVDEEIHGDDAEKIAWLIEPLKQGFSVKYSKGENSAEASLKLQTDDLGNIKYSDGNLAIYDFTRTDDVANGLPARWFDNGAHTFEGLYIPDELKTQVNSLIYEQHDYSLLERYLAIPPNYIVNATVGRIKLPYQHRLARVLAYILIDPVMGNGVKIKGYELEANGKDDPQTSAMRFGNVSVLADFESNTPKWQKVRKVVPHFVAERGSYNDEENKSLDDANFIGYYDTHKKTYIYPTDKKWAEINKLAFDENNKTADGAYERTVYGKVPVYDLIVRPTYTSAKTVMYDEADKSFAGTNQIDFEVTLNNGLKYTKTFTFDLDANHETVVYLHITPERVDYNSSGSKVWLEKGGSDDFYGVNNPQGHTLSVAGSSWQRAYKNGNNTSKVTDGQAYQDAQYVSDEKWIDMFVEAYQGGNHHGDYFVLDHDVTISSSKLPENFVFTGHLDCMGHTITIDGRKYLFDGLDGEYTTKQESDVTAVWEANVHKEVSDNKEYWVPTTGWRAEILNTTIFGGSFFKDGASITGYVNNCWEGSQLISHTPSLPEY